MTGTERELRIAWLLFCTLSLLPVWIQTSPPPPPLSSATVPDAVRSCGPLGGKSQRSGAADAHGAEMCKRLTSCVTERA